MFAVLLIPCAETIRIHCDLAEVSEHHHSDEDAVLVGFEHDGIDAVIWPVIEPTGLSRPPRLFGGGIQRPDGFRLLDGLYGAWRAL